MNIIQRIIIGLTGLLILATLLFPPFEFQGANGLVRNMGYGPIFSPPLRGTTLSTVNTQMLITQWIGIALLGAIGWIVGGWINFKEKSLFVTSNTVLDDRTSNEVNPAPLPQLHSDVRRAAWQRFWATSIDVYPFLLVFFLIFVVLVPVFSNIYISLFAWLLSYVLAIFALATYLALWINLCGTTPGKALLGIAVRMPDGGKIPLAISFKRSLQVLWSGFYFFIFFPIIQAASFRNSYKEFVGNKSTSWDAALGLRVTTSSIAPARLVAGSLLGIAAIIAMVGYVIVAKNLNRQRLKQQLLAFVVSTPKFDPTKEYTVVSEPKAEQAGTAVNDARIKAVDYDPFSHLPTPVPPSTNVKKNPFDIFDDLVPKGEGSWITARNEEFKFRFIYPPDWHPVKTRGPNVRFSVNGPGSTNCNIVVRRLPELARFTQADIDKELATPWSVNDWRENLGEKFPGVAVTENRATKVDNRSAQFAVVGVSYATPMATAVGKIANLVTMSPGLYWNMGCGAFGKTAAEGDSAFARSRPTIMRIMSSLVFEN